MARGGREGAAPKDEEIELKSPGRDHVLHGHGSIPRSNVQSGPQRWDMRRGRSLRPPDLPQLRTAAKCIVQKCAEPFWAALLRLRPRRFASDALCG